MNMIEELQIKQRDRSGVASSYPFTFSNPRMRVEAIDRETRTPLDREVNIVISVETTSQESETIDTLIWVGVEKSRFLRGSESLKT